MALSQYDANTNSILAFIRILIHLLIVFVYVTRTMLICSLKINAPKHNLYICEVNITILVYMYIRFGESVAVGFFPDFNTLPRFSSHI